MLNNDKLFQDIFDEALTFRINTKNYEILLVPHLEFNIVVVQQKRIYAKKNQNKTPTSNENSSNTM